MGKTYKGYYKFNQDGKKEYNIMNHKTIIPNHSKSHQWKKEVNGSIRAEKRNYISNIKKKNYEDTEMSIPKLGDNGKTDIWSRPGN